MYRTVAAAAWLLGVGVAASACAVSAPDQTVAYLQQAQEATRAHRTDAALNALNAAENAWLVNNRAWPNPVVHHERPALRDIALARVSVQQSRCGDADHYIGAALSDPSTLGQS